MTGRVIEVIRRAGGSASAAASAVRAEAAALSAAASATEAALHDGPKVDMFSQLAAVTPAMLAVGGLIRVVETAAVYQRVSSGGDLNYSGSSGVRLAAQPLPAEYVDRHFGAVADGVVNDAAAYATMAANIPAGKTLRIAGGGVRNIGSPITFAQAGLKIVADVGVKILQRSGTGTIDTLVTVSGAGAEVHGLHLDANNSGNPTATYTGRGELLKMSGLRQVVRDVVFTGGHVKPFATGLYITGNDCTVDGVTGYGSGRILIRGRADRATIRNVVGYDVQASALHPDDTLTTGNKVLVWDGGSESGAPFTWVEFEGIKGRSNSATFLELIVVDSATEVGGRIIARNLLADFPNATGPDVIKFVNFRRIDIDGLTTFHAGDASSNASLRLQHDAGLPFTGRRSINLRGLDLAGHINFDEVTQADITIGGGSQIGRAINGPVCIDDLPSGTLAIEKGTRLGRFTDSVLASRSDSAFPTTEMGRCIIAGASGGTPSARQIAVARLEVITTQARRVRARMLSIDPPLEITGTRTPADGRWVFDGDLRENGAEVGGDILLSATDFSTLGPRDTEGWQHGMAVLRRDPSNGQISRLRCVTGGASCQTAWVASTAYTVGAWRFNGANVYACSVAGTSAASGGPTGTGAAITDGSVTWAYVAPLAVWSIDGQIGIQTETAAQIASIGAGVNTSGKFLGKIVRDATNNRLMVARGPAAGDLWDVADGSASVTPA